MNYKSKDISLSPLVLSATAALGSFSANAGRQIGVTGDITQLKNPSRTAFLLDEIRFRVFTPITTSYPGSLAVRLDLGRMQLTAGRYVPIGLMCRPLDAGEESSFSGGVHPPLGMAVRTSISYTFRLPRPLYIPGGETIVPSFMLMPGFDTVVNTFSVDISYVGRSLPAEAELPSAVDVPYVSAWLDVPRLGGTDALAVRSTRSDMKNPFAEPLRVARVMGLMLYYQNSLGTLATVTGVSWLNASSGPADQFVHDFVPTRLFRSDGTKVVRDATPFGMLFPAQTRSLDVLAVLKRNEFLQLQCDVLASALVAAGAKVQLMASVVGTRRVEYAQVLGYGYQEAM